MGQPAARERGGLEGGGDQLALGSFAAALALSRGGVGCEQRMRAAVNVSQLNVKRPGNGQPSRDGNRRRADNV